MIQIWIYESALFGTWVLCEYFPQDSSEEWVSLFFLKINTSGDTAWNKKFLGPLFFHSCHRTTLLPKFWISKTQTLASKTCFLLSLFLEEIFQDSVLKNEKYVEPKVSNFLEIFWEWIYKKEEWKNIFPKVFCTFDLFKNSDFVRGKMKQIFAKNLLSKSREEKYF